MSRLVFSDMTDLMSWVLDPQDPVLGNQYQAIVTSYNEIIFAPIKSTRNLRYGVYHGSSVEIENILEEIRVNRLYISVIRVKSFDWDTTKPVRSQEEE